MKVEKFPSHKFTFTNDSVKFFMNILLLEKQFEKYNLKIQLNSNFHVYKNSMIYLVICDFKKKTVPIEENFS